MTSALTNRVATAAVLIPPLLALVAWAPPAYPAALFGAFVVGAAWEWSGLIGIEPRAARLVYTTVAVPVLVLGWFATDYPGVLQVVWWASVIWWLAATAWLVRVRELPGHGHQRLAAAAAAGFWVLLPAWLALAALQRQNWRLVLVLFVLIWIADSAAYFSGRRFGRTALAPKVSPGKTREGVAGALVATGVYAWLVAWWLEFGWMQAVGWLMLCWITVVLSVVGDLFESAMKRIHGVKDSGTWLPGHGGVLDRVDSLTAAAPVFVLGLQWL